MEQDSRQADIEITPEMVEAGVAAFIQWENSDVPHLRAAIEAVYRAMLSQTQAHTSQSD